MNGHPSEDIVGTKSSALAGRTLILALTGSVGVVKAPDLARALMREGASVVPVMSAAACELLSPNLMEWATAHKPITQLTGAIEHVAYAGNVPVRADALIIAPATANSIGKMACGIDDGPVTTFFTTAFGEGIPVIVVPAMHEAMYRHPFVLENLSKLEKAGVRVVWPRSEEGKAKIADPEIVVNAVLELFSAKDLPLRGRHVVVTAGRTVEPIDPIRMLTNNATGKMGVELARAAQGLGAQVTLIAGKLSVPVPNGVAVVPAESAQAMFDACRALVERQKPDVFISAAAVGDWVPAQVSSTKIPTASERWTLELVATPKIVDRVKEWSPKTLLVVFRAQAGLTDKELEADAKARLAKAKGDLIAANDTSRPGEGFGSDTNALLVVDRKGSAEWIPHASKAEVSRKLLAKIAQTL